MPAVDCAPEFFLAVMVGLNPCAHAQRQPRFVAQNHVAYFRDFVLSFAGNPIASTSILEFGAIESR